MGPRYPTGPRGPNVRMPQMGGDFNGVSMKYFIKNFSVLISINKIIYF